MPHGGRHNADGDPVRDSAHLDDLLDATAANRQAALRLFAGESSAIQRLLARDPSDRTLAAALNLFRAALTEQNGLYHLAWADAYARIALDTFNVGGKNIAADLGLSFNLRNPRVVRAARERAEKLAEYVGQNTARQVTAAMIAGQEAGESIRERAARILDTVYEESLTKTRATRIARTEAVGQLNQGEFETARATEVFRFKGWIHSGNRRDPRDNHVEMDGERVGIDERFSNGLLHPGEQGVDASEVINCGCSLEFFDE